MVYNTCDCCVFRIRLSSCYLKNATFRELICFRPQVSKKNAPILLGPVQRANLNHFASDDRQSATTQ
jgi:hypothetical protein